MTPTDPERHRQIDLALKGAVNLNKLFSELDLMEQVGMPEEEVENFRYAASVLLAQLRTANNRLHGIKEVAWVMSPNT